MTIEVLSAGRGSATWLLRIMLSLVLLLGSGTALADQHESGGTVRESAEGTDPDPTETDADTGSHSNSLLEAFRFRPSVPTGHGTNLTRRSSRTNCESSTA